MLRLVFFISLGILFFECSSKKDPPASTSYLTKVIAHRGAWKGIGAPENSMASLQQAIRLGCYGSEFDVRMSCDSVLFICHDASFQGIAIEKTPASQLSALTLSNGETLPTLQAFLSEGLRQSKTRLILEIKSSGISKERTFAIANEVVQLVNGMKAQSIVEYISFDYDVCKKIIELEPSAKVGYLDGNKNPDQLAADKLSGLNYYFGILALRPEWISEAQRKGLSVTVWTVNEQTSMKWFLERKVDFITTDEPELVLNLLK